MREPSPIRRLALCGALTFCLGAGAAVGGAQAMPAAPALSGAAASAGPTTVQYNRYPDYRYRRFNRGRRAGLYRCGPGGVHTHLERKACR